MIHVCQLFISPGHNFYGQHGEPPCDHPIREVEAIECLAGRGIREDRYLDHKPDYKGQITFFASEVFERMRTELGLVDAHPSATRRNVLTSGVDLNTLIGVEFEIQGVRFRGSEECRPCYWMNRAFRNERAEAWLKGQGGLRARILSDGWVRREA